MRHLLIAASAFAVSGLIASTAAKAEVGYQPGGPERIGNMCKVSTDLNADVDNYGYYAQCGQQR